MKIASALLAAAAASSIGGFSAGAQTSGPPDSETVRPLVLPSPDACAGGTPDEIVVCARRSERDRYRIPELLRDDKSLSGGKAWAARNEGLEAIDDSGIGSCSTAGSGGASGCWLEMIHQARRARSEPPARPD